MEPMRKSVIAHFIMPQEKQIQIKTALARIPE